MHSDDHPRREDIRLVAVLRVGAPGSCVGGAGGGAPPRPHACGSIATPLVPSAMTRHFRILRESGLVRTDPKGTSKLLTLRRDDLDARFPGLLDAVLRTPDGDGPAPGARSE